MVHIILLLYVGPELDIPVVSYDYSIPLRGYRNGYRLPFSAQKNSGADQTAPLEAVADARFRQSVFCTGHELFEDFYQLKTGKPRRKASVFLF